MSNSDSFTETTRTGWGARIKNALFGVLIGPIAIIGAIWLLSWNEGRAIKTTVALSQGKKDVIQVSSEKVEEKNNNKLVYVSGEVSTDETLEDPDFGVSDNVLLLRRTSEMYQWVQKEDSSTSKNMGGSETTTTTYSYSKEWKEGLVDSTEFKKSAEHKNPSELEYPSDMWVAQEAALGAFHFPDAFIQKIGNEQKFKVEPSEEEDEGVSVVNGEYYLGQDAKNPQIGDVRISYSVIPITQVSVAAAQKDGILAPYTAANGTSIALVEPGKVSADELFEHAQTQNVIWTWIYRAIGTLVSIIGFALIMKPLSVLADVVPFIGSIVGFGTGLLSLMLGLLVAAIAIAIAWIVYRPLVAIGIIGLVVAVCVWLYKRKQKKAQH